FVGTLASSNGLNGVLVCQPQIDGNQTLCGNRALVASWLDYLSKQGVHCRHRDYDASNGSAADTVLGFIDEFPVQYSKSVEEMLDSMRLLSTTEVAAVLSEHWRAIKPRDVRRLEDLEHEKRGQRSLGYRECDVATFIKNNT